MSPWKLRILTDETVNCDDDLARVVQAAVLRYAGTDTPYPNGPTAETNALTLCTRHHRVKHQTHWQITVEPDSTAVWTSPTGQQHRTKPPPGDELD